jgi:hypothetical protein
MAFHLGWELAVGSIITVMMPGFTRAVNFPMNQREEYTIDKPQGWFHAATALDNLTLAEAGTNFNWVANFTEGDPLDKYSAAFITLTALENMPAHTSLTVEITTYPNSISPACGRRVNDHENYYFTVQSAGFSSPSRENFTLVDPIGKGCSDFKHCNRNGACNFCEMKCECFDGFGSATDKKYVATDNFANDCSSRTCPRGIASGSVQEINREGYALHPMMECSNNGICDRVLGECDCFDGYEGNACQRMECPGEPTCSAHGRCLSMKDLAHEQLVRPMNLKAFDTQYISDNYRPVNNSWDAEFITGCACDSSWPVGIRDGETQQGEYFGPECQFKRCPSGDDPGTPTVDETDCQGVAVDGVLRAGLVGLEGNKCHVDCSNRGKCDYNTGRCKCYKGYIGPNCFDIDTQNFNSGSDSYGP